ncbi:anthocyanidin 5,3-O-glucosyltransferase [Brachypodium distachyon]|uniref:Glycosyltransferase n=1 Tax=Brachypodium distachyon TaxID=15368 RepID=A0A0Q3G1I2_BRADI|nr:anthocyanidin 5,3-O-glucosyltransferase [Brachypodium distachyon]KQK05280.1 hypothetical protein BRADI_2g19147v3 [Brachypodium distachyon]PNT70851.1 hypothetical protein BRADI_2g19147v3 [Brachypodium distachyon]PNT70852.1 hypothetical protein BRADI_2g19147v3 [Brachypodium distachyon]PNT70853.1 hypothetical protein BRADI_2g19147v3 [Brachypodium distachyon]PNT70854.1 hypothetical protein BRADI_2g19147v3 [Brachypodium distachyon]|eukprot:XP_003566015.1 anthocyanidin 5,3-O-glucosyltransferase [Brachypodium distachyon]
MEKTVVLYPGLVVTHFVPMTHLAGALLERGYAVTVALIDDRGVNEDVAFAAAVARAAASMPSVRFHTLPRAEDPPALAADAPFVLRYFDLVRRYNGRLRDFLCSVRVHAVIADLLNAEALGVPQRLGIPGYILFTCNAAVLAVFAQLPTVRAVGGASFKELGETPVDFFGVPPIPASHLFGEMLVDPNSDIYKATMASLSQIPDADGILVNTFESLEARAVAALRDLRCLPGRTMPPVYCVGPFAGGLSKAPKERHECLAWLDGQPDCSVVFLCFGSAGNHSEEQLKEIALGLENSGHRFLWVIRAPISDDPDKPFDALADPNLDSVLPDGFLERTSSHGLVVKLWAPQVDVLRHRAIGAFVTHCGWNSVLEALMAGVPMLCWPLYAEQKMNKVLMVEEMKVGVELVGWQQRLVKASELEGKVRLIMDSEEGRELRLRAAAHKEGAAAAWDDGGSSCAAFDRFMSDADSRQHQDCSGEVIHGSYT